MTTILLPPNLMNFSATRAVELAHLIELAYQQYDSQQAKKPWQPDQTRQLVGSTAFIEKTKDLNQNLPLQGLPGRVQYEILDFLYFTGFWWLKPETVPFGFIAKRTSETQTEDKSEIFVVFRGTREVQEWYQNFNFTQEAFLGDLARGLVSKGFQIIYTRAIQEGKLKRFITEGYQDDLELSSSLLQMIRRIQGNEFAIADIVAKRLALHQKDKCKVFVTGHSLGGALATLAASHIDSLGFDVDLYTFASPRVGDMKFAESFKRMKCYRIANSEDVVTVVPPATDRVVGDEMLQSEDKTVDKGMTEGRRKTVRFLERLLDLLPTKVFEQTYQHVGIPLYFTSQGGAASTNHNMFIVHNISGSHSSPKFTSKLKAWANRCGWS